MFAEAVNALTGLEMFATPLSNELNKSDDGFRRSWKPGRGREERELVALDLRPESGFKQFELPQSGMIRAGFRRDLIITVALGASAAPTALGPKMRRDRASK